MTSPLSPTPVTRCRPWLQAAIGLTLLLPWVSGGSAVAQTATLLLQQGEYAAAYDKSAAVMSASAQLTAATAAVDQVVYPVGPAASPADQLSWLRRGVSAAENAVRLDPTSAAAVVQLARAKGEIARRSGVLQNLNVAGELKQLFDRALALEPDNPDALVGLALWHLELVDAGVGWMYGGRRSEVLPLLERGVAAAPRQINLRVEYGGALRSLGDEAGAVEQLEIALQLPATSVAEEAEQRRAALLLGR